MSALLEVEALSAGYGRARVLHGIDLRVHDGEIVVVLGANGAGKTTTMRAISGMITRTGRVVMGGANIASVGAEEIVRCGIAHVPQGRGTFPELTVEENLRCGALIRRDTAAIRSEITRWFEVFPRLGERRSQAAGSLSGGEQQMLAIARALMSRPRLLLCDEPSLGLSPVLTAEVFDTIRRLHEDSGLAVLLVEQNAATALQIAQRAYVLEAGRVVASGSADEIAADDIVRRAYLGY